MRGTIICAFVVLWFIMGLDGCTRGGEARQPAQESVAKNLIPSKAEAKSHNFVVELSDLKITMKVNPSSKEITQTPRLQGRYKITNTSAGAVEVQGAIVEYMDREGNPITFASEEKIVKAVRFMRTLQPGEVSDKVLDLTIPKAAVNELAKIDINLVYIPSVLKRETLTLS